MFNIVNFLLRFFLTGKDKNYYETKSTWKNFYFMSNKLDYKIVECYDKKKKEINDNYYLKD